MTIKIINIKINNTDVKNDDNIPDGYLSKYYIFVKISIKYETGSINVFITYL